MTLAIIYGAVFAAALLLVETILRALSRRRRATTEVNERLRRLLSGQAQEAVYQSLLKDRSAIDTTSFEWLDLRKLYRQSGLTLNVQRRVTYVLVIFFIVLAILGVFFAIRAEE